MRITATKHPYYGLVAMSETGDQYRDLAIAVHSDHPCEDNTCDIREALEAGFPRIAALLLTSATEADTVRFLLCWYRVPWDMYRLPEWNDWKEHFDTYGRQCPACGAFSFASDHYEPETCGNCLASLPPAPRA